MQDDEQKREGQTASPAKKNLGKDSRRDRLKLALRENLKRRKSQAKGRSDIASAPFNDDEVSPHEASEKSRADSDRSTKRRNS
jgi:hypothetical protein